MASGFGLGLLCQQTGQEVRTATQKRYPLRTCREESMAHVVNENTERQVVLFVKGQTQEASF